MRSSRLLEVAITVLLCLGFSGPSGLLAREGGGEALSRSPGYTARIDIKAGEISAAEFLRFVSDFTGAPVIAVGGGDPLDSTFSVADRIEDVEGSDISAILEANGWRVSVRSFENGQKAIELRRSQSAEEKPRATSEEGRRVFRLEGEELLVAEDGASPLARHGVRPSDPVAVVARLGHARPKEAVETLAALVPDTEGGEPLRVAPVGGSPAVALSGRAAEVDDALRLLRAIDIEEGERRVRSGVHRLEHANAPDVAAVIKTLFSARSGNGGEPEKREGTAVVPYGDGRLVIRAAPREYEEILRLVDALDVEEE